jgi:hypothetical protein
MRKYASFAEFYPFYLGEHSHAATRRIHVLGSSLGLVCLFLMVLRGEPLWLLLGLVLGYGLAWFAHFVFEKNRPATFKYPFYSFVGDWVMFADMLRGKIKF